MFKHLKCQPVSLSTNKQTALLKSMRRFHQKDSQHYIILYFTHLKLNFQMILCVQVFYVLYYSVSCLVPHINFKTFICACQTFTYTWYQYSSSLTTFSNFICMVKKIHLDFLSHCVIAMPWQTIRGV